MSRTSTHVDVRHLNGVVAVSEPVPGWDVRLLVAGRIGRPGTDAVTPGQRDLPLVRPVLPLVRAPGGVDQGRLPRALPGEAEVDVRDGSRSRPCLSADHMGTWREDGAWPRVGDSRAYAHGRHALMGAVWPLVDVVAGLELPLVRLGDDVDPLEPLDRCHGEPLRHDEPERGPVVPAQRPSVHLVGDEDL